MVLGSIAIFLVISVSLNENVLRTTDTAVDHYISVQVRNIANSTADMLISRLGDNPDYRTVSVQTLNNVFGGSATYRVVDTTISGEQLIKINVDGNYLGKTHNTRVVTKPNEGSGFIPSTVKAAVTTNNPVETLGNLIVDGRNHDINGNLVANSGTYGIWTTQNYSRGGNSKLGSTHSGSDIAPIKAGANFTNTFKSSQVYPGGYPDTPDSILGGTANGFPPGTLKSIAQSGKAGSQYVTNPGNLTYPLIGVTYVELPSGERWQSMNISGSGVLVVHNSSNNAIIKNLNSGVFKGILIADDIIHIHTYIIGAVIGLSSSPSEGNCIGNGNGDVLYSSEAIEKATKEIDPNSTPSYGFAQKRMLIVSWYE
ncbi:MAG: hypothetical protein JW995_11900 [Melioribacteraceae bacterium]|nr:hypothetical protein [Melioribacteraceae bacterium]